MGDVEGGSIIFWMFIVGVQEMVSSRRALLLAFGSDKYNVSLWIASTMSLARKVSIASSGEAAKSKNCLHFFIVDSVRLA